MADYTNSISMNLPIPTVGVADGPLWASLLDSCLTILDGHSHTPGSGVPITPAAMNINADVNMRGSSLTAAASIQFSSQSSLTASGALYELGNDLWYNNGIGQPVQITTGSTIVGTAGSISGLPSGTAGANYVSISGTYAWESATGIAANMDFGSAILRNTSPNSTFSLTVSPPSGLGSNNTITLPANPASPAPVIMSNTGVMTASVTLMQAFCPPGSVMPFAGTSLPAGWFFCDGGTYSRSTYASLYSAIGANYGAGDGSTTFNVPDFRGMFLRGYSGGSGRDPDAASRTASGPGGAVGDNMGSFQTGQIIAHDHSGITGGQSQQHRHTEFGDDSNLSAGDSPVLGAGLHGARASNTATQTNDVDHTHSISAAGGNETRPVNIYVNFIIKI